MELKKMELEKAPPVKTKLHSDAAGKSSDTVGLQVGKVDPVHYYTSEGTEAFTKKVLSYLAPALGMEEMPEYKEVLHVKPPIGR